MANNRSWTALLPLVTAVAYGASPIDLVPDLLLLVGWIDDGMMGLAMAAMSVWLLFRSRRRDRPVAPPLPTR
jgi:uncharacterized membrane protein YkvA (DUF1232 family)